MTAPDIIISGKDEAPGEKGSPGLHGEPMEGIAGQAGTRKNPPTNGEKGAHARQPGGDGANGKAGEKAGDFTLCVGVFSSIHPLFLRAKAEKVETVEMAGWVVMEETVEMQAKKVLIKVSTLPKAASGEMAVMAEKAEIREMVVMEDTFMSPTGNRTSPTWAPAGQLEAQVVKAQQEAWVAWQVAADVDPTAHGQKKD